MDGIPKLEAHKNIWKDMQAVMSSYMDEQKFKGAPMPNNNNLAIVEVLLIAFHICCEGVPSAEDIRKMLDNKPLYKRLSESEEDRNAILRICELAILEARAVVQELRKAREETAMLEARNKVLELELKKVKVKREES